MFHYWKAQNFLVSILLFLEMYVSVAVSINVFKKANTLTWEVHAFSDGRLVDNLSHRVTPYLFWEALTSTQNDDSICIEKQF